MRLIGLIPVRNEEYILGLTLRALFIWCDFVVVLDHRSSDKTPDILDEVLREYPNRLHCITVVDEQWEEMKHRQMLLDCARFHQATHIAMVDADELLTADISYAVRELISELPKGAIMQLPWLCLRGGLERVHNSGMWGRGMASMAFVDERHWHWKAQGAEQYDFHHRHPFGGPCVPWTPVQDRESGLMHLQFVDERRLRAKQFLYQLTERLRWPNRKMADYAGTVYAHQNAPTDAPVPREWFAGYEHLLKYLDMHAEPWQLAECRRLIAEHAGIEKGLDDFGVLYG